MPTLTFFDAADTMKIPPRKPCRIWACIVLLACCSLRVAAHDPLRDPPDPQSTLEAWVVLTEVHANIATLIEGSLFTDIPGQIALTTGQLNYLKTHTGDDAQKSKQITELIAQLSQAGNQLVLGAQDKKSSGQLAKSFWPTWSNVFSELEKLYPGEVRDGVVYICPMHPKDTHLKSTEKCRICSMDLLRRRIPAMPCRCPRPAAGVLPYLPASGRCV